ncbi:MAG: YHS domain-containing protein [Armatimonadetes bacterium]|nr:YHS domain-containing protein [Armatimonadota bacterium]
MRNFGLALAVFAMSFTISSIAFVQSNKSNTQKQTTQKAQTAKRTAAKQEVRCPVSGKAITDTKKAPKYTYRGKTYYFNCQNCLAEFKKNPQKYIQQAANVRTVSNAPAKKEGEACCSGEAKTAACCSTTDAAKASGSCCSDKKEAQPQPTERAAAPADKLICPVSGEELDEATAVRFAYNGKVYYTCCNGCKSKFLKEPETYAKKAEEVSKLQGKPEKADTN